MKRMTIIALLLIISLNKPFAQDLRKSKEVGLIFKGLSDLGVRYRFGSENTLFRVTLTSFSGSNENNKILTNAHTGKDKSFSAGLSFGLEKRKLITSDLYFCFGPELSGMYSKSSHDGGPENSNSGWILSPGLGFSFGLLYRINENLNISSEIVPSVWYSYGKGTYSSFDFYNTRTTGINYSLISPGASLTFSYRFIKKN